MVDGVKDASGAQSAPQSLVGCFVQLGWLMGGNILLIGVAVLIARDVRWTLSVKDVVFWACVCLIMLLRYIDLKRYGGVVTGSDTANPPVFRNYVVAFVGTWLILWALAHSVELG